MRVVDTRALTSCTALESRHLYRVGIAALVFVKDDDEHDAVGCPRGLKNKKANLDFMTGVHVVLWSAAERTKNVRW